MIDFDIEQTFGTSQKLIDKFFKTGVNPNHGIGKAIFVRLYNDQKSRETCVFKTDSTPQASIVDENGEVIKTVSFNADGTAKFDEKSIKSKAWKVRARSSARAREASRIAVAANRGCNMFTALRSLRTDAQGHDGAAGAHGGSESDEGAESDHDPARASAVGLLRNDTAMHLMACPSAQIRVCPLSCSWQFLSVRSVDLGEGEVDVPRAMVDREKHIASHEAIKVVQGEPAKLRVMTMNEGGECRLFVTSGKISVKYRYLPLDGNPVEHDCGPKTLKLNPRDCHDRCTGKASGCSVDELKIDVPNLNLEADCARLTCLVCCPFPCSHVWLPPPSLQIHSRFSSTSIRSRAVTTTLPTFGCRSNACCRRQRPIGCTSNMEARTRGPWRWRFATATSSASSKFTS